MSPITCTWSGSKPRSSSLTRRTTPVSAHASATSTWVAPGVVDDVGQGLLGDPEQGRLHHRVEPSGQLRGDLAVDQGGPVAGRLGLPAALGDVLLGADEAHDPAPLVDHPFAAGHRRADRAVRPDEAVLEAEGARVGPHAPEPVQDPGAIRRVDELADAALHRQPDPRRKPDDPGHLVGEGQLVGLEVPLPAPDVGDPLGLGELAPAGQELALGPPLVGDVPGDHHAADHRPTLVGQGHEHLRPEPGRVLVAGRLQPAALAAERGPAVGLGDDGVGGGPTAGTRLPTKSPAFQPRARMAAPVAAQIRSSGS